MRASLPLPAVVSRGPDCDGLNNPRCLAPNGSTTAPQALGIVLNLCQALEREGISYCQWKSNNALDRSATGDNDLDLLVSRADASRFAEILYRLGFKQVKTPPDKQVPGVLDYFGYDQQARKLVHVHAHYQLSLGHDLTKNYRLPIESAYLESSVQGDLFRIPAPEFEFIVFVVRMILKHSTWDVMLFGESHLKASERREFDYLLERIDRRRVGRLLEQHLPCISKGLFRMCVRALQPASPTATRIMAGQKLQAAIRGYARSPMLLDTYRKLWRRPLLAVRRRAFKPLPRYRLQNGGAIVAFAGGDGAGKSTAIDAIHDSYSGTFDVARIHMGKPAWSLPTIAIRGILKTGQILGLYPVESSFRETLRQVSPVSPGYPWLVREVCTARDRYGNYLKARRYAAEGWLVLLDRFPLKQVQLMDGPQCARFVSQLMERPYTKARLQPHKGSSLTDYLIKLEQGYYNRISLPDAVIVLKLDPQIAVQRKTDEEPSSVLERSTEIWEIDWGGTGAHVVDAGKSKEEVASQIGSLIWTLL